MQANTGHPAAILRGEIRPWMLVGDFSFDRMKGNRTLVNSDWTGRYTDGVYGTSAVTVHPPAPGDFPNIPWEDREDGFVMLGRLSPDKRPDWALQIVERVRAAYPHIHLHLIGVRTHHGLDYANFRSILSRCGGRSSCFTLHEDLTREALAALVARQRYGIHAIEDEHFGMAVAEMVSAGCVPFVHNSGGLPGIVGQDPGLLYGTIDEAVARISHVLANPAEQLDIRNRLAQRRHLFTPEIFMSAIRREVALALANRGNQSPHN